MAHFAELDENDIVLRVVVVHNNELLDENGNESEQKGIKFCKDHFGEDTIWVQTSYNRTFRKRFAGIGLKYDRQKDMFIDANPPNFPSWKLNEETGFYEAPVPFPDDPENIYIWDEDILNWVVFEKLLKS